MKVADFPLRASKEAGLHFPWSLQSVGEEEIRVTQGPRETLPGESSPPAQAAKKRCQGPILPISGVQSPSPCWV